MRSDDLAVGGRARAHRRGFVRVLALLVLVGAGLRDARAESGARPLPLYRVVLTDGSTLASVGECVRVGDRVVCALPVGRSAGAELPPLKLISLPASEVDWDATTRYAEAVRAAEYAATHGEAEYAALSRRIAATLAAIRETADAARRLELALEAQRALGEWSRRSYGYRAREVRELAALLDEVVSELRVAAGENHFVLDFVAGAVEPPSPALLPPPTLQETVEQVLRAARLAPDAASRIDLLRTAVALLDAPDASLAAPWARAARRRAAAALAEEVGLDEAYRRLTGQLLSEAARAARRADVGAVERAVARARARDAQLGRRRPDAMAALLAALEAQLDAARRRRLALDRWALGVAAHRAYVRSVSAVLAQLRRARPALEAIHRLDGPDPARLSRVDRTLGGAARALALVRPPDALHDVHATLASALTLAQHACWLRREAVGREALDVAWDASAAAAGALVLYDRARVQLEAPLRPPEMP